MTPLTPFLRSAAAILAVACVLAPPVGASPRMDRAITRSHVYNGFLKKFRPKIDLGKGARALVYPVKKATVNGTKDAAGAAASYYLSSKKPGVPALLPKK